MFVCAETSRPDREDRACDYENAGWRCNSSGFMGFGEDVLEPGWSTPCPRCNTGQFLEIAMRRSQPAASGSGRCPCCGPGVAEMAYAAALETAMSVNPEAASDFLERFQGPQP